MRALESYSDADFRRTILRALRLVALGTAVGVPLIWWKSGWQSAALLAIGALISGSGLWEWLRLMTAVMARMDLGETAKPLAPVMIGFFLRLIGTVAVLYVSLRYLNGSVLALAAGLAMGVVALTVEGLRLLRNGTM